MEQEITSNRWTDANIIMIMINNISKQIRYYAIYDASSETNLGILKFYGAYGYRISLSIILQKLLYWLGYKCFFALEKGCVIAEI